MSKNRLPLQQQYKNKTLTISESILLRNVTRMESPICSACSTVANSLKENIITFCPTVITMHVCSGTVVIANITEKWSTRSSIVEPGKSVTMIWRRCFSSVSKDGD
jgi:aconitase A